MNIKEIIMYALIKKKILRKIKMYILTVTQSYIDNKKFN